MCKYVQVRGTVCTHVQLGGTVYVHVYICTGRGHSLCQH